MHKLFSLILISLLFYTCDKDEPAASSLEPKIELVDSTLYDIPVIKTEFGEIYVWLYTQTPKHKANFLKLSTDGFYDQSTFHRVIRDFVIQGGDPNHDGTGGPGYTIASEINDKIGHVYGAIGAARLADNANPTRASNGSQFYIVNNKDGTPSLDGDYTVFGKVFMGMDAVAEISKQETNSSDKPIHNITFSVEIRKLTGTKLKTDFGLGT